MATNKKKLNTMNPASRYALLGTKLDELITLNIELKALFNAHVHVGGTGVPTVLLASKAPDPLN